jgi:osmotically-inducible protein OsmY
MKLFLTLVVGIAMGAVGIWFYQHSHQKSPAEKFADKIKDTAHSASTAITDQWHKLRTEDIADELTRTGRFIREKTQAAGQTVANATADARITATIKTKLATDSGLASLSISVNTTQGVVTLAGAAVSAEQIRKAVTLAMETDGVTKVISTLQIKAG